MTALGRDRADTRVWNSAKHRVMDRMISDEMDELTWCSWPMLQLMSAWYRAIKKGYL